MDSCSIITTGYIAQARVLAASFAEQHPAGKCTVLVIDDTDGFVDPGAEDFEVVRPADLKLDPADFDEMRAIYNLVELATALKPWLLELLIARDEGPLVYLDPDIRIDSPMQELEDALRDHSIVLTPHLTGPLPRDERRPAETDILLAGTYNLGFIALAPSAEATDLLSWWKARLRTDCRIAPARGLFVDQRWIDLVPGMFESTHILGSANYNVAYWNVTTRELVENDGDFTVDGLPLRFFHFSGYSPTAPHQLSSYQDRVDLAEHEALRKICDSYRRDLLAAGFGESSQRPYGFGALPGGPGIDDAMRELHRQRLETGDASELFTEAGAAAFLVWCNEPVSAETRLSRYLDALWHSRPDLQAAFPDPRAADSRYTLWAATDAGLPAQLAPPVPPAIPNGSEMVALAARVSAAEARIAELESVTER